MVPSRTLSLMGEAGEQTEQPGLCGREGRLTRLKVRENFLKEGRFIWGLVDE